MKPRELPIFKNWQGVRGTLEKQWIGKNFFKGRRKYCFEEGPGNYGKCYRAVNDQI